MRDLTYANPSYEEQAMASDVTIHSRPHAPIALPPICCYCLEPATTTYPAMAGHYYTGSLGVKTHTRAARRPTQDSELILAITFTFGNDAFAAQVAALHATEARCTDTLITAPTLSIVSFL